MDAHLLIALMAPRPVYVASATKDLWADSHGEFLAAKHATPVYQLLGRAGLGVEDIPPADRRVGDFIGYHVRTDEHDVTAYDREQYLSFANRQFRYGRGEWSDFSVSNRDSLLGRGGSTCSRHHRQDR